MNLKFSQDIEALLRKAVYEPLVLRDILTVTAERGFCLMIALLALPFIFPIPPGLTGIAGLGILLLSLQMLLGFRQPWLPAKVADFPFPSKIAKRLLNPVKRMSRILEKITRSRWLAIAQNRYIWRLNGLCLTWLTLLLMLPIPFTNPLPAMGILILAVAMLEADGLLMGIAYLWTGLLTLGLIFLGSNLWAIADTWR